MLPLLSPEEMAAADAAAISSGTAAGELMERAGRAVARTALQMAGGRYGKRVVIVCGKGNNGGDGFVAARILKGQGVGVTVFLVDGAPGSGPAANHLRLMEGSGVAATDFDPAALREADVVVDAIFGTGFSGAPEGDIARVIEAVDRCGTPVLAVDIPSGVDGATGVCRGVAVRADITLAIEAQKLGTASGPGSIAAGRVMVAPIGIALSEVQAHMLEAADVAGKLPRRDASAHKGSTGGVAILAGSGAMPGAAVLTCRAADRAGAGYVRLASLSAVKDVVSVKLPEVLITDLGEKWSSEAVAAFQGDIERSDALAIGPGIGTGEGQRAAVFSVLRDRPHPIVVDADALNNIAGADRPTDSGSGGQVMTPHPGEMGRLLGIDTDEVQADRFSAARRAAERFGSVVLLKGARTIVAEPSGRLVVNPSGSSALATAGSGDVLTGAIAALLAAGLAPFEAAWVGAFLHGRAGEIAGRVSPTGVVAWDIAEALPAAWTSLSPSRD